MIRYFTVAAVASALMLSGCAKTVGAPGTGSIVVAGQGPGVVGGAAVGVKNGKTSCSSILGLISTGDCSIASAAKNGGIQKISTVDYDVFTLLGLYSKTTTMVTGE